MSRFAGNVPGVESGHRPRKWTTSSRTAETGRYSRTVATCKAFVIPAIAERRWQKCGRSKMLCVPAGGGDRQNAWAHGRGGCVCAAFPCAPPPPPGKKSLGGVTQDRTPPFVQDFFPMRIFREYMACQIRTRRPEREGVYGSAGVWPAGRTEVLRLASRLVLQRVSAADIL